ncbi:MAG: Uma2 family endonuclease [Leptospira sp.]|nr:Uma2 family endonuclease [Leptospira sp.]
MTALAEKLTVEMMVQHPEKWENFELYRGEPFEMTYSRPLHGKILLQLGTIINSWIRSVGYGEVIGGESGIRFGEDTRYSFDLGWSGEALPEDEIPTKSLPLMVEIVSDSNDANRLLNKIEDYLENGAKEVWIIYPKKKVIQVYYPNNMAKLFHLGDNITPGDWMKGFSLDLKELFPEKK